MDPLRVAIVPVEPRSRRIIALAWLAMIAAEILTQLALKFAGRQTGQFDFSAHAFALAIASGWLWTAVAGYCAIFLVWMLILRDSDLSRAFPTTAIVFVAVMFASWLVLHEPVSALQLLGAAVIVAGILQLRRDDPENCPKGTSTVIPPSIITE